MQKYPQRLFCCLIIFLMSNFGLAKSVAAMEVEVSSYLYENSLSWTIAGDLQGENPDILSELNWKDLNLSGLQLELQQDFSDKAYFVGEVGGGLLFDGINQDSDYFGDGRTQEFSRSLSQTGGDYAFNGSVGLGVRILENHLLELSGLFGYAIWVQQMRMIDGEQLIPLTGRFSGLNSTYKMQWNGPWLGIKTGVKVNSAFGLESNLFLYAVNFVGVGDWNLRSDLVHPESFIHRTSGIGKLFSLGLNYQVAPGWVFFLGGEVAAWRMASGYDQIFFVNGLTEVTRLNWVRIDYAGLNLTVKCSW